MLDPVDPLIRNRAIQAARGLEPFDLLFTNGTVVDVGTGELRRADVGVVGPLIASVHEAGSRTDALDVVDIEGRFLAPGFIDMHVHFESSMLTPGGYAECVGPRGTTTIFCDPHELANVTGVEGVRYAVEASRGLPVRFIVQAPSCVPPIPGLELSGADLHGPDIERMLSWPEVGGLAEVMDTIGVLERTDRMVDVVAAGLASGKVVSGHAAGLTGQELQAYLAAGIYSDHEIFSDGEVFERLRAGMTVELRGMVGALLGPIVDELMAMPELPVHLVACTDDLFALTLLTDGGMDHLLRRLIAAGLPAIRAYRIATYHGAYRLQRPDLGLIGAGRRADLLVISDLDAVTIDEVYTDGHLIAVDGEMVVPIIEGPSDPPLDTIKIGLSSPEDFRLRLDLPDGTHRVRTVEGLVMTQWGEVDIEVTGGIAAVPEGHLLQVAVHRHGRGSDQPFAALVSGWGTWTGAIATTFSHDTHNLIVFGSDPDEMTVAANAVIAGGGGVAVVSGGEVIEQIELPIAGILSPEPAADVAEAQRRTTEAALSIGMPIGHLTQPLLQILASSLACLGGPHVTDVGLVDGTTGELVETMVVG